MSDRRPDDDGVEELADDVIIAQESIVHAPAPRAQVATDQASVVISDIPGPPRKLPTMPPLGRRDRTEKTVVIRDRKSLDKLRREASRAPRRRRSKGLRTLYLVGAAVIASLAAGTLLATIANSTGSDGSPSAVGSVEGEGRSVEPAASREVPAVVDLEDLPVEKKKKKKKRSSASP